MQSRAFESRAKLAEYGQNEKFVQKFVKKPASNLVKTAELNS